MSTITEELQRIITSKADIKQAIEDKGVTVGDTKIDGYAELISLITTGTPDIKYAKWLRSTNNAYINLKYIPKTNTSVETQVYVESATNAQWIVAGRTGYKNEELTIGVQHETKRILLRALNNEISNSSYYATTGLFTLKAGPKNYINGNNVGTFSGSYSYTQPLYVFNMNNNGALMTGNYFSGKIAYIKIFEGDDIVMELVPCLYENEAGLYDKVNKKFYGNYASVGSLSVEEIIDTPQEEITDNPHTFNGTEYFDTGIKTPDHTNYTYEVKFKVPESTDAHVFGLRSTSTTNHISIVIGCYNGSHAILCRYTRDSSSHATYLIFGLNGKTYNVSKIINDCYDIGDIVTVRLNKDKAVLINHTQNTQYEIENTGNIDFTLPDDSFYLGAVNTGGVPSSNNKFDSDIYHLAFIKHDVVEHYFTWDKNGVFTDYPYMNLTKAEILDLKDTIIAEKDTIIASKDEIYNSMVTEKDTIIANKDIIIAGKDAEIELLKTQGGGSTEDEYDPELDEYTHIFFVPQSRTTVYSFQINPTGETTVDWGDGTTPDTITTTGIQFVSHTYNTLTAASSTNNGVGSILYTQVEIKIHSDSTYSIEGRGTSSGTTLTATNYSGMNNIRQFVTEIIPANNCIFGQYALCTCVGLFNIKFSPLQTEIPRYCFYLCNNLNYPKFDNITEIGDNGLYGIYNSPKTLIIPETITSLGQYAFGSNATTNKLTKVIWNSPQMFIQQYTFTNCFNLEILDLRSAAQIMRFGTSATSTTMGTYVHICPFSGKLKILVPKSLFSDWIKSTYWRYFWQFLYWVDDDGNYRNDAV